MLNIRDLKIAPMSLGEKMLIVEIIPAYEYKEGQKPTTSAATVTSLCFPSIILRRSALKLTASS